MIVDGHALAKNVLARTKVRVEKLPHSPRIIAYVAQDPTPAMRSYLNIKKRSAEAAGCIFKETNNMASFRDADAVIIQLPTTPEVMAMLNQIPIEKDADVLSSAARNKFEKSDSDAILPPVVGAVREIFVQNKVNPKGKKVVVIGRGFLVGAPAARWLSQQGSSVKIADIRTENLARLLRSADIIVAGAGVPHLIKPDMLKKGVILIDAGTSELDGAITGDASPSCSIRCSLFTPVPGGIGPLAVACLFENVVTLAEKTMNNKTQRGSAFY